MKFGVNCCGVKPDPGGNNIKSVVAIIQKLHKLLIKNGKYEMTYLCPTKPIDGNGVWCSDDEDEIDLNRRSFTINYK